MASHGEAIVERKRSTISSPLESPGERHLAPSMWRRVRRDVALLGVGNVGVLVAQLAFRSMLVGLLAPAAYGRLALVLSVYNTIWMIGASGLPNGVARHISAIAGGDDSAIIRAAVRAGVWPTALAAGAVAVISSVLLRSPLAFLFAAVGLSSLVYCLLTMGILRGRGETARAASIMPTGGVAEVALLGAVLLLGLGVTPVSAFAVFCAGNVLGLIAGVAHTLRTAPGRSASLGRSLDQASVICQKADTGAPSSSDAPSSRQLLDFSMWLGVAAVGIAVLPLVIRLAAALDSYRVVALVDVALVLFSVPQRMGSVIVAAVVPHATRARGRRERSVTISFREHALVIGLFVLLAAVVAFTPSVRWLFGLLGRPEYAKSARYLALALLAGPARVLYGLVEGILIAHDQGRFLAASALSVAVVASAAIFVATALGSVVAAFGVFALAGWVIYAWGLQRVRKLSSGAPDRVG